MVIAFVISTLLGVVLLLSTSAVVGFAVLASERHNHPGLGAVAGGISETAVFMTPLLCGIIGVLVTLRRINRTES